MMRLHSCALGLAMVLGSLAVQAAEPQVVAKLTIPLPAESRLHYQGPFASAFGAGLPLGLGSGLFFDGQDADGTLHFVSLTDRGPNGDAPQWHGKQESKIFLRPDFTPQWRPLQVKDGQVSVGAAVLLHDGQGVLHGLPLPAGTVGATGEQAIDAALQPVVVPDSRGLDSEGIVADGRGGYWLCDEYGPFLIHVDGQGKVLQKYGPEAQGGSKAVASGLPAVLAWRQPNRGFEGIARLPSGKIIAAVQSTLDIEGKTAKQASFIRLLELDPASGQTRMLAYPLEAGFYKKNKDAKLGDLVAVDETTLLAIEQGKDKDKQMHNRIYRLDLAAASDLSALRVEGKEPEFASAAALAAAGMRPVGKQLLVDLQALGWQAEKAEGLALIDARTLAISNDNDFGVAVKVTQPVAQSKDITDYSTDGDGKLRYDGQPVASRVQLQPLDAAESASLLWLIQLPQALR